MLAVALGAQAGDVTDVLDNAWTGVSGTSYTAVTDLDGSVSEAVYSVQCAGGNSSIQLRSNNNNSGIVTTTSGGTAKTLKVTWNFNTADSRVISVYGSNTAYSAPTDLYDATKQGTLIGELNIDKATDGVSTLDLGSEYQYIGIRSKSGAVYLDKVELTWTTGGGPVVAKPTFDPAATSFVSELLVKINSSVEGGTIYYTTDGATPTVNSEVYTSSTMIILHETTTVKAIVVDANGNASGVAEATYTLVAGSDISDVLSGEVGTYGVFGQIVAAGDGGFIVQDATDYIYYYAGGGNTYLPGYWVQVIGTTSEYKGTKQFTSAATVIVVDEEGTVTYPDAGVLTGSDFDLAKTNGKIEHGYYAFTGTLTIDGNHYNIAVDGAEATSIGAIIKPLDDISALNNKVVDVEGYSLYVTSSSNGNTYIYFIATKIEEHVETFNVTMADGVAGGSLEIVPATAAAGETVTVTVIPDDGNVLESITANCININQAVELNVGETPDVYTFEMPADDVVINPVFADAPFEPTELDVTAYQNGWKTDMAGNGVAGYTNTTEPKVAQKEHYNGGTTELTGVVLYQDIEGLEPGTYTVSLVANASYTPGRGFNSEALNGDLARAQVFANNIEMTIPVLHQTGVGTNNTFTMNNVNVGDDGKLSIGIRKDWAGSNWHTIQITKLVWESPDQISDPDTYNEYWQGIRDAILAIPEYNNVRAEYTTGNERENLEAAGTGDEVIAAAGPFYHAKTAADAAKALIEREEAYADASATNGMLTDFIVNGTFDERGITAPWKTTTGAQNQTTANNQSGAFGINNSFFFENWNPSAFTGKMYQEVPGIPNGTYKLSIAAFVQTFAGDGQTDQFVYANEDKTYLTTGTPTAYEVWFVVEDNFAEVGLNQTRAHSQWMGIDNISLTYFGPGNVIAEAKFADILAEYEECTGQKMKTTISDDLETAKANFDAEQSDANAAALKAAVEAAKASIKQYIDNRPAIDAMETLMNSTNVVTEAAYATYYELWDGYNTAWEEGTLDEIVVNPLTVTGWQHDAGIKSNQYLLSAWTDANGEAVTDYNKALYINTWSTEGVAGANNYNGADFGTPFFEYFTDENNSQGLGATTWTATLTDVAPGSYTLSALVRVRTKAGVTDEPTGITLAVNDSEPVSVTTGDPTPNGGRFFQGEYTVQGVVGDDGILTVKFDIADGNNIHWLSFKDLFVTPTTYSISVPELAGATITTDPEGEAAAGETVTITVETEEGFDIDAVQVLDVTGASVAEVEAGEAPGTYTFTMPAENVFIDVTLVEVDPNDYTYLIENPAYLHEGDAGTADYAGWTWSPAPGESGWKYRDFDEPMNLVTYSGNVNFSFEQTIPEVPAGVYRLSVYGFYRAGDAQGEADRVTNGDVTHNLNMFAEVGDAIFTQPIMNLYEGAAEEDVTGKGNHCIVPGYEDLFVPNGADDSRAFYIAGYYRNDLEITVPEDGEVKIGINHPTGMTYDSDYAPIGAWELYRIGDPILPIEEFRYEYTSMQGDYYEGALVEVEHAAILEAIGATDATYKVYSENSDGTRIEGVRSTTNGWRDANGDFLAWPDGLFYVQDNGTNYEVGGMEGKTNIEATYTAKLVYVNTETDAEVAVYITLIYPEPAEQPEVATVSENVYETTQVEYDYAEGQYTEKVATLDEASIQAICEELGIGAIGDAWVYGYNPSTEEFIKFLDTKPFDGWRNANGDFARHSGNSTVPACVKWEDGHSFYCYNIAACPDGQVDCYWAVGNDDGKVVLIKTAVIYSGAPEPPALTYDDLNIIDEQGIEFNFDLGTNHQGDVATVDMAAIKAAFGTPAEPTLTIYAVASDNTLDSSYGLGTSDGWRNADGDWESWNGESVFCVKADFEADSDQIYYVGTKWAASQEEDVPGTYVARYVFVNEDGSENPDAVLFTVTINYGDTTGIDSLIADKNGEQTIYDLSGRRVRTITKGGMYIVNGKKVFVK